MYDYDATGSDEITFEEGDIIKVLKREPNGVDDGWWLGELRTGNRSGTTGLFPSLVVEECYENGEDSPDDYSLASPQSSVAPPSFSPPPRVPSAVIPNNEPKPEEKVEPQAPAESSDEESEQEVERQFEPKQAPPEPVPQPVSEPVPQTVPEPEPEVDQVPELREVPKPQLNGRAPMMSVPSLQIDLVEDLVPSSDEDEYNPPRQEVQQEVSKMPEQVLQLLATYSGCEDLFHFKQ